MFFMFAVVLGLFAGYDTGALSANGYDASKWNDHQHVVCHQLNSDDAFCDVN